MFGGLYEGAMRNGSRLLFAIAVILFLAALLQALTFAAGSAGPYEHSSQEWLPVLTTLMGACSFAVMPLFAALFIHRFDRWLGLQEGRGASAEP
jgi:MFS family permease